MPQMDSVTFLSQVTWLVVVFSIFYLIVLEKILPTLSRILKIRSKKLSEGKEIANLVADEEKKLQREASEILGKSAQASHLLLQDKVSGLNNWLPKRVDEKLSTSAGEMGALNKNYLKLIGELLANKALLLR